MARKLSGTGSLVFCAFVALSLCPACFGEEGAMPGPVQEGRQKLFDRIQQARAQGIGITGYLQAFKAVEDQVKAGDAPDKIQSRVDAINKAVSDQIERAKVLKTQKPIPPQGSQLAGSPTPPPPAAAAPAQSPSGSADLLSKIKEKFGDKLNNVPDSVKDKLMNDPRIMEKIKEKSGGQG
jgi:hypothetical protein